MMTKRIVLATSMLIFTAISGQAFAGATISDRRYWPDETHASSVNVAPGAENAFDSMTPAHAQMQAVTHEGPTYEGGPKSDY